MMYFCILFHSLTVRLLERFLNAKTLVFSGRTMSQLLYFKFLILNLKTINNFKTN